ncbi:YheU family protein [Zhongshania arctica]|uniref:YheU family protein n=1 Tax=Zhongshania arctica TaxID=3238302 RepID=A0ABV3TW12_9GAMM|tara:strand:+ start:540 stop:758 length:219 start_codon:yes stop_codon:yes gene_type:complete
MNEYVEVPWQKLSPDALQGMLEEMVTRDGTDYGENEVSLEEKISQLRRALESNKAAIVFTPETESWTVIAKG